MTRHSKPAAFDPKKAHPDAKRERYCIARISGKSPVEAYAAAGYMAPSRNGGRMEREHNVQARLGYLLGVMSRFAENDLALQRIKVRKKLEEILEFDVTTLFDSQFRLLPRDQWPDVVRGHMIEGISITRGKDGGGTQKVDVPSKIATIGKLIELDGLAAPTRGGDTLPGGTRAPTTPGGPTIIVCNKPVDLVLAELPPEE